MQSSYFLLFVTLLGKIKYHLAEFQFSVAQLSVVQSPRAKAVFSL